MKFLLLAFILIIAFSCKQKKHDENHIDVLDTQMAELRKDPPLSFTDSIKYLKTWNIFYKSLSKNETSNIIKMSFPNVYCPVYQNQFNYYRDSKLVLLYFFLQAPNTQKYINDFSSKLDTCKPVIYDDELDNQEMIDYGLTANKNMKGFSVIFYTEQIAGDYKIWRSHQFKFIEDNGTYKFIRLNVDENGSMYQWKLPTSDSLYLLPDSFNISTNRFYSKYLLQLKEPILYKNKSEDEVYRFTWLRAFNNPVIIRFEKHNNAYTLYTKEMLDYKGYIPQKIKVNKAQQMNEYVWYSFKEKLKDIDFWKLNSKDTEPTPSDGAEWLLEGATKNMYHFTERNSPSSKKYRSCCLYLLTLSNLDIPEKEIY